MSILDHVKTINLSSHGDERGILTAIEGQKDIPFEIKRVFYMHHITADRGGHAHIDTDQVVIAAHGQFKMDLSDGQSQQSYTLNQPTLGIYTPRMTFITLYDFSPDALCLVLASTPYDMGRSLRSWEAYLNYKQTNEV